MQNLPAAHPYKTRIADWPEDDRPREKLLNLGTDALSDAELLAIILRVGTNKLSAIDLARHILTSSDGFRGIDRMDIEQMTEIPGIGTAKAAQIKAAIAIGKRLAKQEKTGQRRITCSKDVFDLLHLKYRDRKREVFGIILLTSRNKVLAEKELLHGTGTERGISRRERAREIVN